MRTTRAISAALAIAALSALGGCASLHAPVASGDSTATAAPSSVPIPVADLLSQAESPAPDESPASGAPGSAESGTNETDLWSALRQSFSLPDGNETQVREQIAFFKERTGFIERTAQRSEPYLYYVVQQLQARGMPTDLALLPVVESGFNPYAYSPGRAAGLWQFISSTGRIYGLKQNSWYDGRLDIVASTNAALKYLQNLHDQFDGNWLLALAAYNSGSITVQNAIDYNRRHGRPTDFWHLNLPAQTRAYVPRLLAIRDMIANPAKYGLNLPPIANTPYLAKVDLKGQMDLAIAAKLAGMDLKALYQLNPGYSRWETPPEGPSTLLLPAGKKNQFLASLDDLQLERAPGWSSHRVNNGETLSGIAADYHTTVATLRERNGLHGNLIRVGTTLKVPTSSGGNNLRYVSDKPMQVARNYTPPILVRHSVAYSHIQVRSGDTLWGLAHTYRVSVADLAKWNHLGAHDQLRVGQQLSVLRGATTAMDHSAVARAGSSTHYVVKDGDSLSLIASRFKVSTHALASWNSITAASVLHPGQRLVILGNVAESVAAQSNQPQRIHYVVKAGDSLYAISNRFNVSLHKLTDWNSLSASSILQPGQLLTLFVSASN
ncbi:MAG: LysM peptidoglycan-binding domain-containing protein [Gammaproteobacteria bacterium]